MLIDMLFTVCSIKIAKNEGYKGPDPKVRDSDDGGCKDYGVPFPTKHWYISI
jgi:hypothetical protein